MVNLSSMESDTQHVSGHFRVWRWSLRVNLPSLLPVAPCPAHKVGPGPSWTDFQITHIYSGVYKAIYSGQGAVNKALLLTLTGVSSSDQYNWVKGQLTLQ